MEKNNDYISRINRVLDYIEKNLDKELTLELLANVACFSKYHFHRIFYSIMKETLSQYIQRNRFEKAANLLILNPNESITDISFNTGFSSSQAFSRGFKKQFNKTATEWRKTKQLNFKSIRIDEIAKATPQFIFSYDHIKSIKKWQTKINGEIRETIVKEWPKKTLAYYRYIGPYKGDSKLFQRLWNKLIQWAAQENILKPNSDFFSIYHDSINITDEDKLRTSVAINVEDNFIAGGEFGTMELEAGQYASTTFLLGADDYSDAWFWVYSQWLPQSGYQPDDRPSFEFYPPQKEEYRLAGKNLVEITIPVKPLK